MGPSREELDSGESGSIVSAREHSSASTVRASTSRDTSVVRDSEVIVVEMSGREDAGGITEGDERDTREDPRGGRNM